MTNGQAIEKEIAWFTALLDLRFRIHGGEQGEADVLEALPPPPLPSETAYGQGVAAAELGPAERLILILALLPHLRPQALDPFLIPNSQSARPFTEFGGGPAGGHSGFRPTRETALFLLAGETMDLRLRHLPLFASHAPLHRLGVLERPAEPGELGLSALLSVSTRWLDRLTLGKVSEPHAGPDFPAQKVDSRYELGDLVLPARVRSELADLISWVTNEDGLIEEWGLAKHVRRGYRALFYGPPGTGKTATAAAVGNHLGLPVFRIDLSRVVSKWIGETEKNLAALFDHADHQGMILFFDEADALFGKRGDTRSANDRHANQQIAYLLQRIEETPGVAILASNLKSNIDPAFARRFQAMVHFPMPDARSRLEIWQRALGAVPAARRGRIDLQALADRYELSGGAVVNALRHACTRAAAEGRAVEQDDLRTGIAREFAKEGRQPE